MIKNKIFSYKIILFFVIVICSDFVISYKHYNIDNDHRFDIIFQKTTP